MGKISEQVSKGISAAIAEVQAKVNGITVSESAEIEGFPGNNTVEALLNAGAEAQKKRKRRTKAEMEAAKQAEKSEENSLFEALQVKPEESKPLTHEEFCELELKKAKEKGVEQPDFDFRNFYEKGEVAFYVHYLPLVGEIEVVKVTLRTIYPRMMVGTEEKAGCHCIGYAQRDMVFKDSRMANDYAKTLDVSYKYGSERSKMDENDVDPTVEGVEDENLENEAYKASNEE